MPAQELVGNDDAMEAAVASLELTPSKPRGRLIKPCVQRQLFLRRGVLIDWEQARRMRIELFRMESLAPTVKREPREAAAPSVCHSALGSSRGMETSARFFATWRASLSGGGSVLNSMGKFDQ